MVVDHHQLNVFGLVFNTAWQSWSLREDSRLIISIRWTNFFFSITLFCSKEFAYQWESKNSTANSQVHSCFLHHVQHKSNNRSISLNFQTQNQTCLFARLLKMWEQLGEQAAADWLHVFEKTRPDGASYCSNKYFIKEEKHSKMRENRWFEGRCVWKNHALIIIFKHVCAKQSNQFWTNSINKVIISSSVFLL